MKLSMLQIQFLRGLPQSLETERESQPCASGIAAP